MKKMIYSVLTFALVITSIGVPQGQADISGGTSALAAQLMDGLCENRRTPVDVDGDGAIDVIIIVDCEGNTVDILDLSPPSIDGLDLSELWDQ